MARSTKRLAVAGCIAGLVFVLIWCASALADTIPLPPIDDENGAGGSIVNNSNCQTVANCGAKAHMEGNDPCRFDQQKQKVVGKCFWCDGGIAADICQLVTTDEKCTAKNSGFGQTTVCGARREGECVKDATVPTWGARCDAGVGTGLTCKLAVCLK